MNKSKEIKKYITGLIIDVVIKYPKTLDYGLKIFTVIMGIIAFICGIAKQIVFVRTQMT